MYAPSILRLSVCGTPTSWLSVEDAAIIITKNQVSWTIGENAFVMRGGINRITGYQTTLSIPAIIATAGDFQRKKFAPTLTNTALFRRDQNICMYCGGRYRLSMLSRDHIIPRAQGGANKWTNVVTACKRCNHAKGNRTPEQANMPLIAVPFEPNQFEYMSLINGRILDDQMDFLSKGFSKNYRTIEL